MHIKPDRIKEIVLSALNSYKGDDVYRARAAFKGFSIIQMGAQHGESGKSRQEILDEYESHAAEVNYVIDFIKAYL